SRQPRRGCVAQPRVAVRGYPWGTTPNISPTPKGLRRPAQGCRPRLPLGYDAKYLANPEGVASPSPGLPSASTLGGTTPYISPTPKGLRRPAQGCRPALPGVGRQIFRQPRRGCVARPRVAVRGYPWGTTPNISPTPKGLRRPAQGCRPRLPWVGRQISRQPRRGCVARPRVAVRGYPG